MSQRDESRVRLGVFVVMGILVAIAGLLAFGAGRFLEHTTPVYAYFTESVQGLEPGAEIKYRGVRIGRVVDIQMRPPSGTLSGIAPGSTTIIEVVG